MFEIYNEPIEQNNVESLIAVIIIMFSLLTLLSYIIKHDWTEEEHEKFNKSGHWK